MNARSLLQKYRKYQYALYGRYHFGVMNAGVVCDHSPFEQKINHGDVVHPCVRYISNGYLGHKWWMVYTPYYRNNDKTENPILCYGENNDDIPPTYWHVHCQVQGQPQKGYNSDPALLFTNNKLYVFWRENLTEKCSDFGFVRATFGAIVKVDGISTVFGPVVGTKDAEIDPETSPTFIEEKNGTYRCLATHITFHSKIIKKMPATIQKLAHSTALIFDLLGLWSQQKAHGIAQWSCNEVDGAYRYDGTFKFEHQNGLYRPWHIDFFEWNEKLYAIIQSNQCNADICLAESVDRIHFRFFKKPLMTNETCGKVGIYKPTGGVVNNSFYLYYTAQDKDNRELNKLYLTVMDINQLFKSLE